MSAKIESLVAESIRKHLQERKGGVSLAKEEVEEVAVVDAGAVEVLKEDAPEGKEWFSKLFGSTPMDGDFLVDVLKSVHPAMSAHVPTADPSYVVQVEECADIVRAFQINDRTLITGPTGSGKSSLVKYICAKTNRPMVRINMTGDVESSSIFGLLTVEGGATVWKDGAATEAVKYGAVLVNDEWDVTPPEIMFGYQNLMEDGGYLFLKEMPGSSDDKRILPHHDFRFVCCGNTTGQGDSTGFYAGTNVQNNATLNRFGTTVKLDYLATEHEENVLKSSFPSLTRTAIKDMVQYAQLVRVAVAERSLNLTISPRDLLSWARKMDAFNYGPKKALRVTYIEKLRDEEAPVANELMNKVFGV